MICFYHSADLDGLCSAAIVKGWNPDAKLHPINYGEMFPWQLIRQSEDVFMVDFCLQPFTAMMTLNGMCQKYGNNFHWIDHHKTSIENAKKNEFMTTGNQILETGSAACELTWEYLYPAIDIPRGVWLLGRYDVWDLDADEYIYPFQMGMRSMDIDPESPVWESIFSDCMDIMDDVCRDGETIVNYQTKTNKKICKATSYPTEFEGLKCIASNNPLCNSQTFESVWDPEEYDAMLDCIPLYRQTRHRRIRNRQKTRRRRPQTSRRFPM